MERWQQIVVLLWVCVSVLCLEGGVVVVVMESWWSYSRNEGGRRQQQATGGALTDPSPSTPPYSVYSNEDTTSPTDNYQQQPQDQDQQRRHHRRLLSSHAAAPPSRSITVIGVGLPRSGSETMHAFWTCQGLPSRHYCCDDNDDSNHDNPFRIRFPCRQRTCGACVADNLRHGRPALDQCGGGTPSTNGGDNNCHDHHNVMAYWQIDVESAHPYSWFLPQHGALPALAVPPTTTTDDRDHVVVWVLTLRSNATVWADSVLHWHGMTQRLQHALGIDSNNNNQLDKEEEASLELPRPVSHDEIVQELQQTIDQQQAHDAEQWERKRQQFIQAYERHRHAVQRTAAKYHIPFVTVVVDDDDDGRRWQQDMIAHGIPLTLSKKCWDAQAAARRDEDWNDFSFDL